MLKLREGLERAEQIAERGLARGLDARERDGAGRDLHGRDLSLGLGF